MALKGCYAFLKWSVFLVNLVFWLAGIGVLAASLWLIFDSALYLQPVATQAETYATGAYILLAAGALMTIIGFLGCCGALRESQCLLGTFFVFLLIILVAEVAAGVWAYMNKAELNQMVSKSVKDTVKEYKQDKAKTAMFDQIQKTLKCCGADNYRSWASSAYNGGEKTSLDIGVLSAAAGAYKIPESCCAEPTSSLCQTARQLGDLAFLGTYSGIMHSEGCTGRLQTTMQNYSFYIFNIGIGICIIELIGMIFSMLLCCAIRKIDDYKA